MKTPTALAAALVAAYTCGCAASQDVVRSTRWDVHSGQITQPNGPATGGDASKVVRGAPYRVLVSLSPKPDHEVGPQDGEWVFYKGDLPFGRFSTGEIEFGRGPTQLALDAHSSAKTSGSYRYELYLDDELVTEVPVEIVPPPKFIPLIEH